MVNNPITHPAPPKQVTPGTPGKPSTPAPAEGSFYWPVDLTRVVAGPRFMGHYGHGGGWTRSNLAGYRKGYGFHTGNDFLGPLGLAVVAIYDGVVTSSTPPASRSGYGNNVVIRHSALGLESRYSHLDSRAVKAGDVVKGGQLIGRLGTSGTDNAHLHCDLIELTLPNPRFCPHNPATGGVRTPLIGLDPIEEALTEKYFRNLVAFLNAKKALNPVTHKVATV